MRCIYIYTTWSFRFTFQSYNQEQWEKKLEIASNQSRVTMDVNRCIQIILSQLPIICLLHSLSFPFSSFHLFYTINSYLASNQWSSYRIHDRNLTRMVSMHHWDHWQTCFHLIYILSSHSIASRALVVWAFHCNLALLWTCLFCLDSAQILAGIPESKCKQRAKRFGLSFMVFWTFRIHGSKIFLLLVREIMRHREPSRQHEALIPKHFKCQMSQSFLMGFFVAQLITCLLVLTYEIYFS